MHTQSFTARTVSVAGGRFAPGHLGELTQLLPFEMIDEALTETRKVQTRLRDLPSRVVVYLLLAGCLFPELGYPQVWHRLVSGLHDLPVAAPTAGALCQARRRIGPPHRGGCSTCCAVPPPASPPPARGGADCSSARSTAPP